MDVETLYDIGLAFVFSGMLVLLGAILLLFLSSMKRGGKVRGGGLVIVGPFPIVFGTDKESVEKILLLALALTILLVVTMVVFYVLSR
jgi:uncharacterized protein (TIGR00304 family)